LEQLVASLLASSTLLQDDNNLFQTSQPTTGNKQCEHILLNSLEVSTHVVLPFLVPCSNQNYRSRLRNDFTDSFYVISRATVRPAVEPIQEKSTENKITTPAPLNEESLQLQSIISDISVISDPKLLIPAKTNLKRVRLETGEPNHES
jgi:hypothetical protein